ncbi:MAG: formate--phosphoribosylaminoimidazolecarboxamide ligase [Candidatus Heimdallarchaeota archaeon]|nr:formate--phosphoribosylaminoimidazolecarboxamide ligase [Candidatus Heimdallarchaeota archaeon]MCK4878175.1 formate--phosphoribosylaminoimidazolecarboxamide ligase [Candidatus Heimdallarchaeota archaeon]
MIISTVGSHSALQILYGAKQEGLRTKVYCLKGKESLYERYLGIKNIVSIDSYEDLLEIKPDSGEIFIPHGTIIATLDEKALEIPIPFFGNRKGMLWEMKREKNLHLLQESAIRTPKSINAENIDQPSIVKFPGAKGGEGYFLCTTSEEFKSKISSLLDEGKITKRDVQEVQIQEYIVGVTMYPHYFYSIIYDRVEMLGIDRRYETNVDALGRISQEQMNITPSYKVVGNQPLIIRESLLPDILDYGDRLFESSKRLFHPGLIGPFCIELALTTDELVAFEFTSRIVAGTSLYVAGSPYSKILFNEEMSMSRRIAREIKMAMGQKRLEELLS